MADGSQGNAEADNRVDTSRHASIRSLERYARPGPDAVAAHVARRHPFARRKPR